MKTLRSLLMAGLLALTATAAACVDERGSARPQTGMGGAGAAAGSGAASGGGGGAAGDGRVKLTDWVDDLAVNHNGPTDQPDTVEDKVSIIIDTDDPAAFDPLLQRQAQ